MTTPTPLSPAAQAVLIASAKARCFREWDHVNDPPCHPDDADWNGCYQCISREGVAAALRAAADQFPWDPDFSGMCCCEHLKAIAAELDGGAR
jgi:hypothetical protein